MLTELRIKNFAIIESLTLPLARGFNVLSGETGAGKSIIVGALGLLLGERASADLIRTGADGGRTRAWVNGTTVTAGVLAEIGRLLVNLHGQHEAQTLLDGESQRRILDAFAGAAEAAARVRASYDALAAVRREIADLARRKAEAERRADYLRHVVREIEEARLVEGEDTRLEDEARRLEHAEELRALAAGVVSALDGDEEALLTRLGGLQRALASLQRIDPSLARLQELYDNAYIALEELSRELEEYERSVELDPERLEEGRRRRDLP